MRQKFTITLVLLFGLTTMLQAQLNILTNYYDIGLFNESVGDWEITAEQATMYRFKLSKDYSNFEMNGADEVSKYTILDWDYDSDEGILDLEAESESGTSYLISIFSTQNYVVIFYQCNEGHDHFRRYYIDTSWEDE